MDVQLSRSFFFFSSRRRHTRFSRDWSSDVCSSDLLAKISPELLKGADEVFFSSTAGGIMPVGTIDKQPIADGKPGPTTLRLRSLYWSKREAGWHGTKVNYGIALQAAG